MPARKWPLNDLTGCICICICIFVCNCLSVSVFNCIFYLHLSCKGMLARKWPLNDLTGSEPRAPILRSDLSLIFDDEDDDDDNDNNDDGSEPRGSVSRLAISVIFGITAFKILSVFVLENIIVFFCCKSFHVSAHLPVVVFAFVSLFDIFIMYFYKCFCVLSTGLCFISLPFEHIFVFVSVFVFVFAFVFDIIIMLYFCKCLCVFVTGLASISSAKLLPDCFACITKSRHATS